jgi:pSer/pThr/pTyr-binding forkhead associated (FHA) protein
MWKLTIEDDEQKQTSLPLVHEEYAIGRAEGNVIRLTDRNVSRKHAIIRRTSNGGGGQAWVVRDLDSYNGTYVNGLRVAGEAKVAHGDVVQLGDYRLELADEQKTTDAEHPVAGHAHRPPHQRPDRLVVVVGPTPGQEFPLVGDHFTMGRAEDASISINHSSVSRLHAEIFALGNGRYEIIDKGSANGIRVNGHELKRGIFEAGDAIELGDVRLRFVGAGKIFRAGFDRSQQLSAVKGFDSVSPASLRPQAAAKPSSGLGKWIGIGVVLGLVGLAAAVLVLRGNVSGGGATSAAPTDAPPSSADPGVATLAEAKALADAGKLAEAHAAVVTIPESSSARGDPAFADIEARWADSMFERVAATEDDGEKRKLLHLIASTETVDATRRKKAAGMIQEIDPSGTDPATSASPDDAPAPSPRPGGAADDIYQSPTPRTPGGSAPGGKPAPSASTDFREGALNDPEGTMNALIRKMQAGTASEAELRVLRGLCTQLNNRSCRSAANAALKALENQ